MNTEINEIEINGIKYVRKDSVNQLVTAPLINGLQYCVIRTYSAGVHIGYVAEQNGTCVKLINSRRLWSWSGANSLSQVAIDGCQSDKFAVVLPEILLTEAIEIIPVSKKAKICLDGIPVWKK